MNENKLITLRHIKKCLDSIRLLIGKVLTTTADALDELEEKIIPNTEKGVAEGVASLDEDGKVPKDQLPDDIGNKEFIGTTAEFEVAKSAGQIEEGMIVNITDDYQEGGGGTGIGKANTKEDDGYVTKGEGHSNQVWATDAEGNPGWRDGNTVDILESKEELEANNTKGKVVDALVVKEINDSLNNSIKFINVPLEDGYTFQHGFNMFTIPKPKIDEGYNAVLTNVTIATSYNIRVSSIDPITGIVRAWSYMESEFNVKIVIGYWLVYRSINS